MGIYRCQQCAHIQEVPSTADVSDGHCHQCQAEVKIYDTTLFVTWLLGKYRKIRRQLRALQAEEESASTTRAGVTLAPAEDEQTRPGQVDAVAASDAAASAFASIGDLPVAPAPAKTPAKAPAKAPARAAAKTAAKTAGKITAKTTAKAAARKAAPASDAISDGPPPGQDEDANIQSAEQAARTLTDANQPLGSATQRQRLQKWFASRGATLEFDSHSAYRNAHLEQAASAIARQHQALAPLLGQISWATQLGDTRISLDVSEISAPGKRALQHLFQQFQSYGLFISHSHTQGEPIWQVHLAPLSQVQHFFQGEWLQWYALAQLMALGRSGRDACARKVSARFANSDKTQLDLLMLPEGGQPIVIQCRATDFHGGIGAFTRLKSAIHLPPERLIVLASELDPSQALMLSGVHKLSFLPPDMLFEHLQKLLAAPAR